jgi:hypothetical protein
MEHMTIRRAAALCGGRLCGTGDSETEIGKIVIDTRALEKGDLFAAFRGERVDGHDFIPAAFERGAACCIGERVPEGEKRPVIVVDDVLTALEQITAGYRGNFDLPVVGITGSVGKTTAKEMISAVLEQRFRTLKTEGNLNNRYGVPMMLSKLGSEHEAAVIEMGISEFGEMRRLAVGENPDVSPDGKTLLYDHDGQLLKADLDATLAAAPTVTLPQPEPFPPIAGEPAFAVAETRKTTRHPLAMKPGDAAFHVSCEATLDRIPAEAGVLVRGAYKESDRAFQLFVNAKGIPAFAMRQADGTYVGAHGGEALVCGRRYRLVGIRVGDTVRLYVDGRLADERNVPLGILPPRAPVCLVVCEGMSGEVTNLKGGFNWPADIPRPTSPRELFGE